MVDWDRPLKMLPRPDVDGGTYGPDVYLRAMISDKGEFVPLDADRIDRDTQRHFLDQHASGVRFMVVADREGSKPIYYKADGSPWLDHHARLVNRPGGAVPLAERALKAHTALRRLEKAREEARRASRDRRDAAMTADPSFVSAADRERDLIESHPLWGTF